MRMAGIDPGKSGAIAFLPGDLIFDMPVMQWGKRETVDGVALADLFREHCPDHVFIERVNSMPKQGVASSFAFGQSFGIAIGVVAALQIAHTFVTPQQWKKDMRVSSEKNAARARASQLMPALSHNWPLVKHHGRAEAALIASYGMKR